MKRTKLTVIAIVISVFGSAQAWAHFPWVIKDSSGKAVMFFGENLADRTYKLPPSIAKAELHRIDPTGDVVKLTCVKVDTDKLVGLVSDTVLAPDHSIGTEVTFGIHNGSRLNYCCAHLAKVPATRDVYKSVKWAPKIQAHAVTNGKVVDVYVFWNGKPLEGVEVKLSCEEGHDEGNAKTDTTGKVSFSDKQVEDGLNAIMVGHRVDEEGEIDGTKYTKAAYYLTLTFPKP
jgi:uncharacterized GH25 family protein